MKKQPIRPFHLAFPIKNIEETKSWYTNILGCSVGRESERWIDFNFFGHQIVAHLSPEDCLSSRRNPVDGDQVPVRHFGVILAWEKWENLCAPRTLGKCLSTGSIILGSTTDFDKCDCVKRSDGPSGC